MMTSDRTIRWIENLAEQELSIKSGDRSSIDITTTKDEVLAIETSAFLRDLLYHFEYLVKLFNSRVEQVDLHLKLVRQVDLTDGFYVTRNNMRLSLTSSQPGKINFNCVKLIAVDTNVSPKTSVMFSGGVEARFGTFHDVEWFFLGSPVQAEQVARHCLTEFIQVTRTSSTN